MKRSLIMTTAAVVTGLTLFATACANDGSAGKKDSSAGAGGDSATVADNAVKMRRCLRENGIEVPDPEPGQDPRGMTIGGDADPRKMQEAMKKCGMSTGTGAGKEPTQEDKDKELEWIRCMRENGVALKDPEYHEGGMKSATEIPKGQEKAFEEAQKKCDTGR
ncbi:MULTISPECIES: hypothetical protein [unclassified Streptomyces]|uniref:hypothetical protein n=1 Tax=unclassified Streptomyces TaxID=2593676 RepID=UPI0004BD1F85|nr:MULTISPECIES: hypothetical protein [unclassified Streptomyces]